MRRGTTPTLQLAVTNEDGSACDLTGCDVYVTFEEIGTGGAKFTKREDELEMEVVDDTTIVTVTLSQEETLAFKAPHSVKVQLRAKHGNKAIATGITKFKVEEILLDGEI